ncbi:hypothetical protein [Salinisphaera sp. Q1T1-3]|uniref:hypothetical protein n=1 Tax=Salinisphaera sp. Q1T1-3 TaxID=2321229 RepID=UPI000E71F869|nr:hypothetical protein [Salinisphaera sp. Q1T1-3]RJS93789.1 hypothetical protein D3260_06925 [Salinisphaera sp. Q1T1-3]
MIAPAGRRRLLLVGLGHVHMQLLARHQRTLAEIFDLTVLAPHGGRYIGHALACLAETSVQTEAQPRYVPPPGVEIRRTRVIGLQPLHRRLWIADGQALEYDAASLNTGHRRLPDWAISTRMNPPAVWSAHSVDDLFGLARVLEASAGSAGVVIAGGTRQALLVAEALSRRVAGPVPCTLLWSGQTPGRRGLRWFKRLAERGVDVVCETVATGLAPNAVITTDGRRFFADHLLWAGTGTPSALAYAIGQGPRADRAPTDLRIDRQLRMQGMRETFASGATAGFDNRRALSGRDARRQAVVLASNIAGLFDARGLRRYRPTRRLEHTDPIDRPMAGAFRCWFKGPRLDSVIDARDWAEIPFRSSRRRATTGAR